MHQTVAYISAIHSCFKAKSISAVLLGGLKQLVLLWNGSKVMLHSNLLVKKGLVNASLDYVEDII